MEVRQGQHYYPREGDYPSAEISRQAGHRDAAEMPGSDSSDDVGYAMAPHQTTPPKIKGVIRSVSVAVSVEPPQTADMSWGLSSDSDHLTNDPWDEYQRPADVQQQLSFAEVNESVPALSRLERIKAIAIKSANKELGVDATKLADALGLQKQPSEKVQRTKSSENGKKSEPKTEEDTQMRYLADTLGLPPTFFGLKPPSPNSTSGKSVASSPPRNLFQTAIQNVPLDEDSESDDDDEANMDSNSELELAVVAPQPHSLASALGMSIDPSSRAPPVRKGDFKPHPTTVEEKRAHKEKAMSRLNRMKAKAIKSANKSLGVDENNMTAAVGMTLEEYEMSSSRKKPSKKPRKEDSEEIQYIADALGFPVEIFGVKPKKLNTTIEENNADQHIIDEEDSDDESESDEEHDDAPVERVSAILATKNQPQQGSLAAALGMAVGSAYKATSPSPLSAPKGSPAKKSLMNAVVTNLTAGSPPKIEQSIVSQPQAGSLAAALGMRVDDSTMAPPVRRKNTESSSQVANSSGKSPQPGSLAAALGMQVVPATNSPVVSHQANQNKGHQHQPMAGSLAAALGMNITPPTNKQLASESLKSAKPKPGSLAAALGMGITASPMAAPRREDVIASSRRETSSQDQPVLAGSLAAALGLPIAAPQKSTSRASPQQGSLADALGMGVDSSVRSALIHEGAENSQDQVNNCGPPQSGSLAAALGMGVGATAGNPPIHQTSSSAKPQPGSLEALGMSVDSSSRPVPVRQEREREPNRSTLATRSSSSTGLDAQPGSLAAALGMGVDYSLEAPPVRQFTVVASKTVPDQPRSGSLAHALGMQAKSSSSKAPVRESSNPQPGSLAAALGMAVADSNTEASAVRSSAQSTPPEANVLAADRQNLFHKIMKMNEASHAVSSPDTGKDTMSDESSSDSESSDDDSVEDYAGISRGVPQAGSLAAALGMSVDFYNNKAKDQGNYTQNSMVASNPAQQNKRSLFGAVFSNAVANQVKANPKKDSSVEKPKNPQAGSLAAALGMAVDPDVLAPPVRQTREMANARVASTPVVQEVSRTVPVTMEKSVIMPATSDHTAETESRMRVELATARAETVGANAYAKAVEAQMMQLSKSYAEKLAVLQQQIVSYQREVADKSRMIKRLEAAAVGEQKANDMLCDRLSQTSHRLSRARALMDESDSLLQQEFADISALQQTLQDQRFADSDSTDSSTQSSETPGERTSLATRDIESALEREGDRRESLKARLQAMRDDREKQ